MGSHQKLVLSPRIRAVYLGERKTWESVTAATLQGCLRLRGTDRACGEWGLPSLPQHPKVLFTHL